MNVISRIWHTINAWRLIMRNQKGFDQWADEYESFVKEKENAEPQPHFVSAPVETCQLTR